MNGRVSTFYSFKGGVGRTQALANVAVGLASRGRTVVLVDMDMESPGLHTYFHPLDEPRHLRDEDLTEDGVLEWLEACAELPPEVPNVSFVEVSHPSARGRGRLLLVPSGRVQDRYAERLASFSWERFYESQDGFRYVEIFRRKLLALAPGGVDHVLIDSRTGFTDVASVCTFQLPDSVLLFFAPHQQGIDGVARMARAIVQRRADDRALKRARQVFLVPSKVDLRGGPEDEQRFWFEEMHLRLDGIADELLGRDDLIEYSSAAAWGETVLDPANLDEPLTRAYRGLIDRLDGDLPARDIPPTFALEEDIDVLDDLREGLQSLATAHQSLDWGAGVVADVQRWAADLRARHAALWRRTRRHLRGVAAAARAVEESASLVESLVEPPSLRAWEQLLQRAQEEGERIQRAWRQRTLARLTGLAGDEVLVTEQLKAFDDDFTRWRVDSVDTKVAALIETLPDLLARRKLEDGALTFADFSRWIRVDDRRSWLVQRTQAWLEEDWEDRALRALRNLLELLSSTGEVPEATHWTAYDVLCDKDNQAADAALNDLGVRLWVAAWRSALNRGEPVEVATTDRISTDARARFNALLQRSFGAQEPNGYSGALAHLQGELVARWADPSRRSATRAFVATNAADPLLRMTLWVAPATVPGRATELGDLAAVLLLRRLRQGDSLASEALSSWLLGLVDRGWRAEAFDALLRSRDLYGRITPTWVTALVVARRLLDLAGRGCFADALATAQDEDCIRWAAADPTGVTVLVAFSGLMVREKEPDVRAYASLRSRVVSALPDELPPSVREWLLAIENVPADMLTTLDEVTALWRTTRELAEPNNFYGSWPRSADYHREFVGWWRRRLDKIEQETRPSDEIAREVERFPSRALLHELSGKLGGRPPDGDPVNAFHTAFRDAQSGALDTLRARGPEARWSIRSALDTARLRAEASDSLVSSLGALRGGAWAWIADALADLLKRPSSGTTPLENKVEYTCDPRLVRENEEDSPHTFIENLLALSLGERTYASAAKNALKRGRFSKAAELARAAPHEVLHELLAHADTEWESRLRPLEDRRERWRGAREDARRDGMDVGQIDTALQKFDAALGARPRPGVALDLDDLDRIGDAALSELDEQAAYIDMVLADTEELRKRRRVETTRHLKKLRDELDEICERWVWSHALDADRANLAGQVIERFGRAFAARDVERAGALVNGLRSWLTDDAPAPEIDGPFAAVATSRTPSILPPVGAPREIRSVFSSRIDAALKEAARREAVPFDGDALQAALDAEEPDQFRAVAAHAAARYGDEPGVRASFLVAWGRVALTRDDGFEAAAFFLNAFRQTQRQAQTPTTERCQTLCAWGVVLALMLPHLDDPAREQVRRPDNLAALFRRPLGLMPFGFFDHLGLWDALAEVLVELGGSGTAFFETHLLPFLKAHPRAAVAFFRALASRVRARADDASVSFTRWLSATVDDGAPGVAPNGHPTANLDLLLRDIRDHVERHYEDTDLGQEVLDVIKRRLKTASAGPPTLVLSLATPEVTLAPQARASLRVSWDSREPALLRVRPIASLHDESGGGIVRDSLPSQTLTRIDATPGEVNLDLGDEVPPGRYRLRVVLTQRSLENSLVEVTSRHQTFGLSLMSAEERTAAPNPYVYKLAVKDGAGRYGRRDEIEQIKAGLIGRVQDNAVLVLGPRRIGKTTLLFALRDDDEIKARYVVEYIDLQYVTEAMPAWRFYLTHLIEKIQKAAGEHGLLVPSPPEERLRRNPHEAFRGFMDSLDRRLKARQKRMLLLIDELDRLVVGFARGALPPEGDEPIRPEILGAIRSSMQRLECVSFLLAGAEEYLNPLLREHGGRLFQLTVEVRLRPLPDRDARDLAEGPARGTFEYTPDAITAILDASARQPWLIQSLCHHVYKAVTTRRARTATLSDAQAAARETLKSKESFLHLREVIASPDDQLVIQAVAEVQRDRRWVFLKDVERVFRLQGRPRVRDDLRDQLRRLTDDLPYIVERNEDRQGLYRVTVPLYARHLRELQPDAWLPIVRG